MVVTVGVGPGLEALLRDVDFTTDYGMDALRFGGIVERATGLMTGLHVRGSLTYAYQRSTYESCAPGLG